MILIDNQIYIKCIVKDTHGDVVEIVTIDEQHFNFHRLVERIKHNEIIVFASNITESGDEIPIYRLVHREIGGRQTLRSIANESFRLENMPECIKDD